MKKLTVTLSMAIFILLFQAIASGQDDAVRMFISTELKGDPAQMTEAEKVSPGDPVYFVVKLKYKYKIGDLASTDPKTGQKNVHVCFQTNSYRVGEVCTGILKSPVSEQDLNSKSAVLTLIPAANDTNAGNIDFIRKILDMFDSKYGQDFDLRITYKNYDSQKSADFKVLISMDNYRKSRWNDYNDIFVKREAVAKETADKQEAAVRKQKELASTEVPPAFAHDLAAEKQLLAAAQDQFGSTNRIYKSIYLESDWRYERNEFGILLARWAYVAILRKETATNDCFVDGRLYARQVNIAGNTWAPVKLQWRESPPFLLYISCNKFVGFK